MKRRRDFYDMKLVEMRARNKIFNHISNSFYNFESSSAAQNVFLHKWIENFYSTLNITNFSLLSLLVICIEKNIYRRKKKRMK
jgi:hypothetical protein